MTPGRWWLASLGLAVVVVGLFWPALSNGFVWDDGTNVVSNPHLRSAFGDALPWAFSNFRLGHFQPLSWLSLRVDHGIWGEDPWGYHLTNVLLHGPNVVLFAALARALLRAAGGPAAEARALWGSLLAAAIFAVHPMRVEPVAWVTERRDVLSAAFLMLSLLAYLRAVPRRAVSGTRPAWLAAAAGLFALSLLSKAVGLGLPLVLCVLDAYPLGRWRAGGGAARRLLLEKAPFALLSLVFGGVALAAQARSGALIPLAGYGPLQRLAQMGYSALFYPRSFLATAWYPLYERPAALDPWSLAYAGSLAGSLLVSVVAVGFRRRFPAGLAAWAAYLALLAPVSGVAQSGVQLVADRYSYVPAMSWALLLGGGASLALAAGSVAQRALLTCACLAVLATWGAWTRSQIRVWHDDASLWRHVLEGGPSALAYNNLGALALARGRPLEALPLLRRSLEVAPAYGRAYANLELALERGGTLAGRDELEPAAAAMQAALPLHERSATAWYALGLARAGLAQNDVAAELFQRAVRIEPRHAAAWKGLGLARLAQGRRAEALAALRQAVALDPRDEGSRRLLQEAGGGSPAPPGR